MASIAKSGDVGDSQVILDRTTALREFCLIAPSDPRRPLASPSASAGGASVRVGILGASRWAPTTFINSARENTEVVAAAVASRDVRRARAFAAGIKIANVDGVSGAEAVDTAARYGGRYEDVPRRIPDSTQAQRELGLRLQVDVEEGIRRTIDWVRADPWHLEESAGNRA